MLNSLNAWLGCGTTDTPLCASTSAAVKSASCDARRAFEMV